VNPPSNKEKDIGGVLVNNGVIKKKKWALFGESNKN
jgi:hypothetical protein